MFGRKCCIIAVVHVLPLPGSAGYRGSMGEILDQAVDDALTYKEGGVDALLVENMHDVPYLKGKVDPETTAAMAVIAREIKHQSMLPTGLQILAGANLEALGAAIAADLDFLRVEGFVYAHVGDEGIHESCAAQLMRRRANLRAQTIKIFADIKKKHSSHAITADVCLAETAKAAEFFGADGVVVTGNLTAVPADVHDVATVSSAVTTSVLVGSGVTPENIHLYVQHCDAVIVGSTFKVGGCWRNSVDVTRVHRLVDCMRH
ncbi:MAG: BtpA/SgcQ family protein [Candidatus Melainabacteria bacterium]|nr:BtpA/SgcQ family protein [Candidatus Melainabacteria bacterium]